MNEEAWLVIYGLSALIPAYGACLFLWWWKWNKWHASPMYVYIFVLLLGQAVRNGMETYVYHLRAIEDATLSQMNSLIFDQWWWPMRLLVPLCVTVMIVSHLTWRVFTSRGRDGDSEG